MTDITTFPSIQDVLVSGDNIREYTATEGVTKGQVVGFAATGVADAVVPMDSTTGENAVGVALETVSAGGIVKVACAGCRVKVANADDNTPVEAGEYVQQNANAVLGTVSVFTPRADLSSVTIDASDDTTVDGSGLLVGQAETAIAKDGTGTILLSPSLMLYSDHTVVS